MVCLNKFELLCTLMTLLHNYFPAFRAGLNEEMASLTLPFRAAFPHSGTDTFNNCLAYSQGLQLRF